MVTKRIIPCLDVNNGRVVKGINFVNLRDAGDPVEMCIRDRYKVYNGNLLFHGCIPMEEDGSFAKVNIYGKEYSGKALFDICLLYTS